MFQTISLKLLLTTSDGGIKCIHDKIWLQQWFNMNYVIWSIIHKSNNKMGTYYYLYHQPYVMLQMKKYFFKLPNFCVHATQEA
jgi:hypothetical protein